FRSKASPAELEDKLARMLEHVGTLEKQITELNHRLASSQSGDLAGQARDVDGIQVIAHHMPGADRNTLRETVDALKSRLDSTAVVLGTVADGKVALVAGVSQASSKDLPAGELVNFVAQQVGGKGGGRPDMAQAGGSDPDRLDDALAGVYDWVTQRIGAN